MIYIGSGITENYFEKAEKFLEGMNNTKHEEVECFVITLNWEMSEEVKNLYSNIKFIAQNSDDKALESLACLQYGAFTDVLHYVKDEDVIAFVDSDIIIQRNINDSEVEILKSILPSQIGTNNNNSGRTLATEYVHIAPVKTLEEVEASLDFVANQVEVYCCGVLVATKKTFDILRTLYIAYYDILDSAFKSLAKIQFLLSILIYKYFEVVVLPNTFHSHGCWGFPEYCKIKDNVVTANNEVILLNHHFDHHGGNK